MSDCRIAYVYGPSCSCWVVIGSLWHRLFPPWWSYGRVMANVPFTLAKTTAVGNWSAANRRPFTKAKANVSRMICCAIAVCTALYGTLFSSGTEAAYSNLRLWESIGSFVAFGYSFYLCAAVKLYILTSLLVVGMLGYLAVEYLQWKTRESPRDDEALELSLQASTQLDSSTKSLSLVPGCPFWIQ